MKFAEEHAQKDGHFWKSVLFSDESKFYLGGGDGTAFVWRKPGEEIQSNCIKGAIKYGGGWGCFSYICELMNSEESVKNLFKREKWIFFKKQDNDPKQTSHLLKEPRLKP